MAALRLAFVTPLTLGTPSPTAHWFGMGGITTLTVSGDFANSDTLNVDIGAGLSYIGGDGEGGSSLTITGTLSNTKTVQVGNSNSPAANTLTLGALTNASGASFQVIGSASHLATLAFTPAPGSPTMAAFRADLFTPLTLDNAFTNSHGQFGMGSTRR